MAATAPSSSTPRPPSGSGAARLDDRRLAALGLLAWVGLLAGLAFLLARSPGVAAVLGVASATGVVVLTRPRLALTLALTALPFLSLSLPGGAPLNEAVLTGAVVSTCLYLLVTRSDRRLLALDRSWVAVLGGMLLLATVSLVWNTNLDFVSARRMGHLLFGFGLLLLLSTGVIEGRLAARALLAGLFVAGMSGLVALGAGLGDNGYQGRLTGLLNDPNGGAYYLVVLGSVAMAFLTSGRSRLLAAIPLLVFLAGTLSRTGVLSAAVVLVWVLGTRGGRLMPSILFLAVVIVFVAAVPPSAQVAGPFRDRAGTDVLRAHLLTHTKAEALSSPLIGTGPHPHRIPIPENHAALLPHNSYLAMVIEGGVGYLVLWMGALTTLLVRLTALRRRSPFLEAAILALFVHAAGLGEVLLELPAFVAIGFALAHLQRERLARAPG